MICTALDVIEIVLFPQSTHGVSSVIHMSGSQVLGGMLAGWALGLRSSALGLIGALLQITIFWIVVWFPFQLLSPASSALAVGASFWMIFCLSVAAYIWLRYNQRSRGRRLASILLFLLANVAGATFSQTDGLFWQVSSEARTRLHLQPPEPTETTSDAMHGIAPDRLWEAQPALVKSALDTLQPRLPGQANIYGVAVAAGGAQQLFSREARLARDVAAARFGANYRGGVLLSNGQGDLLRTPLATRSNMLATLRGVADHIEPTHDIAFLYLASHGSRNAELSTDLPSYDELAPISAASVADALARAGIKRRIIVISACFAGSWIPALASDDTIVIVAARRDRTSFGCDDTRRLTYFGQAFLTGPAVHGASLRDNFEAARKTVASWEAREKLTPSPPAGLCGQEHADALDAIAAPAMTTGLG